MSNGSFGGLHDKLLSALRTAASNRSPPGHNRAMAEPATLVEIPLFPLSAVLFPGGPLPLRIFEARYIDLVRKCLREDSGFGVVMLLEGEEVDDGPPRTCDVGTYAKIVDFSGEPGGLLGIQARGERRFRIHARRREKDGLNVADVEWLAEAPAVTLPDEFEDLGPALDNVLDQVGEPYSLSSVTWTMRAG